jgi:hypothetical protein
MPRPSYTALLEEIARLRDEIEDLRASAIAWRELYEAAALRVATHERIIRRLTGRTPPPPRPRRGPIH